MGYFLSYMASTQAFITTHQCGVVRLSVASVCLTVCTAPTFESLDVERLFLVRRYIFRILVKFVCQAHRRSTAHEQKSVSVCLSCLWVVRLRLKDNLPKYFIDKYSLHLSCSSLLYQTYQQPVYQLPHHTLARVLRTTA